MEVDCVGVVFGTSSGDFVVVMALEGSGLVPWSSWRMVMWCWNVSGDLLERFSLMSVAGNMLVAAVVCLFRMVIQWRFLDFLYFFDLLEFMQEVWVLVWWRWPEVWG